MSGSSPSGGRPGGRTGTAGMGCLIALRVVRAGDAELESCRSRLPGPSGLMVQSGRGRGAATTGPARPPKPHPAEPSKGSRSVTDADQLPDHAVAVIGMAGRFPDARDVGELWQLLLDGQEAVHRFDRAELLSAGLPEAALDAPDLVPYGTVMPDVDLFDAEFFGMTPQEARLTDPQQRIFLEVAYAAMQDAGVHPGGTARPIGIFGGTALSSYLHYQVLRNDEFAGRDISFPLLIGNDKDFLCTRAAYRLGLTGPAVTVQSACSTSLTAVHLACQSLIEQECAVALAGGVSITVPQTAGYRYQEGGTLSRDGHCRPFDAAASGMVKGNGCAVVVLKRLSDALADRDHIYAVVRGTAVNNDGSVKAGYTAPSPQGQAEVIREATAFAGVRPAEVGYVEAHGTGTYLGDPIEIRALAEAYAADPPEECLLGSVKANVGHLDAAAGVTGLIKAALALRHRVVPPQPNFVDANPELMLDRTPFVVPTTAQRVPQLRVAAVSSFGIGGTNAHCVLGAAPDLPRPDVPAGDYLVALSAKDEEALGQLAADLVGHLDRTPDVRLDDLAWTLLTGRPRHARRLAFAARDLAEVRRVLGGEPARPHPAGADWTVGGTPPSPELAGDLRHARTVPLPGHPLRPQRYWIDPSTPVRRESTPDAPAAGTDGVATPAVPDAGSAAGAGPASPAAAASAGSDVDADVLGIVRRHLDMPQLGADDDFFAVGGESLTAVEIVSAFRERFGVTMTLVQFEDLRTPARM